jgi:pyruvate/2-oxoglutarate dehydrogenase complex dihydrolipoamide acyltransferase (E2) component
MSILVLFGLVGLVFLAVAPAKGGAAPTNGCGASDYSYAGLQSARTGHGVAAALVAVESPAVSVGHVAGWIGVGGTDAGPGGTAEWLQTGLAAFDGDQTSRLYYEVALPGSAPKYVELSSNVGPGERHSFAVLEMAKRPSWWRVWVDHKPVTAPIHLPGSHGSWQPQAVAENWNGNEGACNAYDYRFANVRLARHAGGNWRPLRAGYVYHDAGYEVVRTSSRPSSFVAASLVKPGMVRQAAAAAAAAPADSPATTTAGQADAAPAAATSP